MLLAVAQLPQPKKSGSEEFPSEPALITEALVGVQVALGVGLTTLSRLLVAISNVVDSGSPVVPSWVLALLELSVATAMIVMSV